jgi:hypothetical protein
VPQKIYIFVSPCAPKNYFLEKLVKYYFTQDSSNNAKVGLFFGENPNHKDDYRILVAESRI